MLRLDAEGGAGGQRYVPLVVRSSEAAGRTVLMHAPATWQAYNLWGGYNLYEGKDGDYRTRSLVVSFDRPYDKDGAEKFMVYERAAVVLAERLNLPLAYTTGLDVDRDPGVLDGAAQVVILGHDEYMTPAQRAHLTRARDAGTNIAILGANTCFRRVRLDPTPWSRRTGATAESSPATSRRTPRTPTTATRTPWSPPTSAPPPPPTPNRP
ncbi:N,N-dimethylformamidase beta subunit family domain-containing protein [Streptomyces harbinensis]|uniref:N,N-dimethylformamidase beta subunit family domain-containing protein n=1 Tax=Streptomyces harbinensis TaxID=1176198 RepID=UPI00369776EA